METPGCMSFTKISTTCILSPLLLLPLLHPPLLPPPVDNALQPHSTITIMLATSHPLALSLVELVFPCRHKHCIMQAMSLGHLQWDFYHFSVVVQRVCLQFWGTVPGSSPSTLQLPYDLPHPAAWAVSIHILLKDQGLLEKILDMDQAAGCGRL